MQNKPQSDSSLSGIRWNSVLAVTIVLLVLIGVILFIVITARTAQGQTYIGAQALARLIGSCGQGIPLRA